MTSTAPAAGYAASAAAPSRMALPNPYGGAVDALLNFCITRARFDAEPEADMRPEWRLSEGGAAEALREYLRWREVSLSPGAAFDLRIDLANIVAADPFGCSTAVRAAIEDAITVSWRGAVREDRMAFRG